MDPILAVCNEYGIPVIEDAVEAVGADAHRSMGNFGIFSFNGNKIITTSGAGMLVSNISAGLSGPRRVLFRPDP